MSSNRNERLLGRMFASRKEYEAEKDLQARALAASEMETPLLMAVGGWWCSNLPEEIKTVGEYELRCDVYFVEEMHGVTSDEIQQVLMRMIAFGRV